MPVDPDMVCSRLIECAMQSGQLVTPLIEAYGDDGTCWSEFDAAACVADCRALAEPLQLHCGEAAPACCADEDEGFPRTYRFDCMDVRILGDSDGDGVGDADAFQATVLGEAWTADIDSHRLNFLLTVTERDTGGGTATIEIGSGIGTGDDDQCVEPTSAVPAKAAAFDAAVQTWGPGVADVCSAPDPAAGAGTYDLDLAADEVVYMYSADDAGTALNCVPGGAAPDAIPLRALSATMTAAPGEDVVHGELTGCLTRTEAAALCSCLGGECVGEPNPSCSGCAAGSVPLDALLGSIGPTDACTAIAGEEAFDIRVGFSASRLPDVPSPCG